MEKEEKKTNDEKPTSDEANNTVQNIKKTEDQKIISEPKESVEIKNEEKKGSCCSF